MAKVFAAFPKGTTGEQIVDFWIAQMEEDLAREKAAEKKAEESK